MKLPPAVLLAPAAALLGVVVLTAALMATQLAGIFATGGLDAAPTAPTATESVTATSIAAAGPDLAALAHSEFFGHYDPATAATADSMDPAPPPLAEMAPADLPEATLGLSLQGVVYRGASGERRAIIAGPIDDPRPYRIGDTLPEHAIIRFIEERRIVIEHQGELKALPLIDAGLPDARQADVAARIADMERRAAESSNLAN